jgi:hypothetical protein
LNINPTTPLVVTKGGTGANNAASARTNLGAAASGANSDITSLTGLTGVIQAPTFINDVNGNAVLGFASVVSAVNYLSCSNSITGVAPSIGSLGSDTNINVNLIPKGTGVVATNTTSNNILQMTSGTGYQHSTVFVASNTAASQTVTFPDASGTVQLQGQSLGAATATSIAFSPTTGGIIGTTTNDNASSGYVGEFKDTGLIGRSSFGSSGTTSNLTSFSLTAGDWDVSFQAVISVSASASISDLIGGIQTTSAGVSSGVGAGQFFIAFAAAANPYTITQVGELRVSLATTTTIYLTGSATYTGTAPTYYCQMTARRVR